MLFFKRFVTLHQRPASLKQKLKIQGDIKMNFSVEQIQLFTEQAVAWAVKIVPTFILAVLTLVIGLWIIKRLVNKIRSLMAKQNVESTLANFSSNMTGIVLKLLLALTVISMLGVATTSFIAILGAAGLAVGLALQGNLANFAGGVMILIFKPFKLGDYIVAQGVEGVVVDLNIFCTALDTLDNQRVYVPNGPLSSNVLNNLSANESRRVDVSVALGNDVDVNDAKEMFLGVLKNEGLVQNAPEKPFVSIEKFSDLGIHYTIRAWVKGEKYWDAYFKLHEATKKIIESKGLVTATPTRLIKNL